MDGFRKLRQVGGNDHLVRDRLLTFRTFVSLIIALNLGFLLLVLEILLRFRLIHS